MEVFQKNWFIIFALIVLPPVGIFLLWKYKKLKKPLRIIVSIIFSIVTLFYLFVYSALSSDTSDTTDTPNNSISASQTESNSDESTHNNSENPLMSATICEAPVMNGTKTEEIGAYGYVQVTADEFKKLTPENYAEFAKEKVKDSGYNWFAVSVESENIFRVLWAGCYIYTVDFGTWETDGTAIDEIETWELVDDTYVKIEEETEPATETTVSMSLGEKNALKAAKDYLDYSAFSKKGLIEQLKYEGFTNDEAVFAVDNCNVDWNEQAVKMAKQYLDYSSFSKKGLINQLEYEGFSHEEAVYGVEQNGY